MKIAQQNIGSPHREAKKPTQAENQTSAKPKATLMLNSAGDLVASSESSRIRWICVVDPDGLWGELSRFGNDSGTLHCEGGPEQGSGPMGVQVENDAGERITFLTTIKGDWTVVADPKTVSVAVNVLIHAGLKREIISATVSKAFLEVVTPAGPAESIN